ncbi:uncharacterized protein BDR25DRAFT_377868 [Lindgomyces ingoldianus]|uniref:Uncharacterized protein n=1 Tax=Lindgomyces ingoldianus TaxID=673940 RepID=A0ACB6QGY2_9PLEO|nr:uncharacterized protein BDR25DRAFT_377868 [Lindgomyces ingoldianus]KAF2466140.1 hypothetical protein BDR25DRAFT_377868 [Lindgomyces ingoldianus]
MRISFFVASLLFVAPAASLRTKVERQDGPVDPGTAPDCTYFDTALDISYTCNFFEKSWSISHTDFVDWNPSVKSDCSGLKIGNSYCVEVNYGLPRPTSKTTSSSPSKTPTPTATGSPKPSPTQKGLINTCTKFYKALKDDNCNAIVATYGTFTLSDFLAWNPAVGSDCGGLWIDYYYCVGVPGTPTAKPTSKPPSTTPTKSAGPSPTQSGIVANCQKYYKAVSGDNCQKVVDKYGTFSLADFLKWNPAVGADCGGLWLDYYYCVAVPGTPTVKPSSTSLKPTPTCNPTAPTPTQPGAVCGCKKWHKVADGNTCDEIIKQYGITKANFNRWNPNVGSDCKTLWLGYYVCVSA